MGFRLTAFRKILLVCGLMLMAVALVVALGIIPPAKADTYPGVKHGVVVMAFGINIGLTLLSSFSILFIAFKLMKRSWKSTSGLVTVGVIVLLLGLALWDAASAYQKHGPGMQTATVLLFICSAIDFLISVTVMTTALLRPKANPTD